MQFTNLISQLPLLALFLGTAAAVDMQAFQGSGCDNGASVYWNNVQAYNCITAPLSFGMRWFNMPTSGQGQAYYDSHCTNFAQVGGSGTYCLDAHNNMRSGNWFWASSKMRARQSEEGEMTTGVKYTCPDGDKRIIASPKEFDHVIALINAENWEELAKYPADPNLAPDERS